MLRVAFYLRYFILVLVATFLVEGGAVANGPSGYFDDAPADSYFEHELSANQQDNIVLQLPRHTAKEIRAEREKARNDAYQKLQERQFQQQQQEQRTILGAIADKQREAQGNTPLDSLAKVSPFVKRDTGVGGDFSVQNEAKENDFRQELYQKYGSPDARTPVKAQSSAPKPLQAAYEAMSAGDEALALEYYKQYQRYQKDVMATVKRGIEIEDVAKDIAAGHDPEELMEKYPEFAPILKLEIKKRDDARLASKNQARQLSEETRRVLKQIKAQEYDAFNNTDPKASIASRLNEKETRAKARKFLKSQNLPHVGKGNVDVMFFIKLNSKECIDTAGDIEQLYKRSKRDKKVNLMVLTVDSLDKNTLAYFRKQTGTTFPVASGFQISRGLGVSVTPTAIFVVSSNNQMYTEEGLRNYYFYDEILNIMQGK